MTEQETSVQTPEAKRRNVAELLTAAIEQTADVLEAEQLELHDKFPAMAHQPAPPELDPKTIRDFTQSDTYRDAVDAYIAGRLEVNLMVRVLDLLQEVMPAVFYRL